VKDLSLEIPNAPQVFLEREAPMSTSSSITTPMAWRTAFTRRCSR
jgi:preprotein translocase subunit SecB